MLQANPHNPLSSFVQYNSHLQEEVTTTADLFRTVSNQTKIDAGTIDSQISSLKNRLKGLAERQENAGKIHADQTQARKQIMDSIQKRITTQNQAVLALEKRADNCATKAQIAQSEQTHNEVCDWIIRYGY